MNTSSEQVISRTETTCCIVGCGPAGAMLGLLLARKGISVTVLEAAKDFERDFRGDTLHAPVLQIMHQLGLVEKLLKIPHIKAKNLLSRFEGRLITTIDLNLTNITSLKYPFTMVLPQARFLEFITDEARCYPHFQLIMRANVRELIWEDGMVRGVRYREGEHWHEVQALLTVGADGRNSRVRTLANLTATPLARPVELLWFRLEKVPEVFKGNFGLTSYSRGSHGVLMNRETYWQASYYIAPQNYQRIRTAGLPALREAIVKELPELRDSIDQLEDWKQISHLTVQVSRLSRWHIPGLLFLGDAAHVMSPLGGFGINLAIQDAVVAANVLHKPLQEGYIPESDLESVQRQRMKAIRMYQTYQVNAQRMLVESFLEPGPRLFLTRLFIHLPIQRILLTRLLVGGAGALRVQ